MAAQLSSGTGMRWMRVAASLLLVPLVLAAAALAWLAIDREGVRRAVEGVISDASGRPFTIEGRFDYELGRIIRVRADKVRWRNGPAAGSPYMLEIERLSASIDLFSLFDWPIVVTRLEASDAKLVFEWHQQAGFNWKLKDSGEAGSHNAEPLPLIIDTAAVRNVSIGFLHPVLTEQLVIVVKEARHQQDDAKRLVVTGVATLDGRDLALDGRIGPFPELAVGGAIDLDVAIQGPLAELRAVGRVASLAQLRDLQLTTVLEAPSAAELAPRLKLALDTTGEVHLRSDIVTEGEGIETTVRGTFGEYRIDAGFVGDNLESLRGLDADIRSTGPSLRDLAAMAGLPDLPDAPYTFEARAQEAGQGLEVQRFRLEAAGLRIQASGRVGGLPDWHDIDLDLTAEGANFGAVARLFDRDSVADLPFQLAAAVVGNGPGEEDQIEASLRLGDATATVAGSLSEQADLSGSRLQFSVDVPDADQLTSRLGLAGPVRGRLQLQGSASMTERQIDLDDLQLTLADAELSGSATIDRGPGAPAFQVDGQARGPNLAVILGPMLPEQHRQRLPQLPFTAAAKVRRTQGVLDIQTGSATLGGSKVGFFGRIDMNKPGVELDGELSVSGDNLAELLSGMAPGPMPAEAFSLNTGVRWAPGAVRFEDINFATRWAKIGGAAGLIGDAYSRIEFDLDASGDDLTALVPVNDLYGPAQVPFRLLARGATDLAAVAVDRFEARLGDAQLLLSGDVTLRPRLAVTDFKLTGSGKRLSDLGTLGSWRLTDRPFSISASLQGDAAENRVEDLRFESGENNLTGRLRFLDRPVPFIDVAVESTRLDLDEIRMPVFTDHRSAAAIDEDRVFSQEPLPFHLIDNIDAEISLRIDDLITRDRRWRNLVAEITVDRGTLEIRQAQVDAAKGKVSLRGLLKPTPAGRNITLELTAADAMIALQEMTADELEQLSRNAVQARLSATGNTPHELAASLDGFVWVIGGEGKARRTELDALIGDFFTQLLKGINLIEDQDEYAAIVCQAMFFEVDHGKVETSPAIVIRAEDIIVVAVGTVDLASEKIDFTFETTPLSGIGVSVSDFVNPFTKLTGELSAPKIVLDPSTRPGESIAAVATAGLTVVLKSLWKSWFASRDVCEKFAGEAVEIRAGRDPHHVPNLEMMISGTDKPGQRKPALPAQSEKDAGTIWILDEYED